MRRMPFQRYAGFAILLVVALAAVLYGEVSPPAAPLTSADRISVYDGDTIRVNGERIRILGLDTPEYGNNARCRSEAVTAEEAKQALRRLIARGDVTISRRGTDRYGRTLARVTVDGRDVADTLIAQGLARPYGGGYREGWCS
jgi:micrococcal nuclease